MITELASFLSILIHYLSLRLTARHENNSQILTNYLTILILTLNRVVYPDWLNLIINCLRILINKII